MKRAALLCICCLTFQLYAVVSLPGTPGLVASWNFDSTAGNTYFDVTGHGYDATGTGTGLSLVQGVKGNAINCPGSGFNITVANSKDSFALNHFTVEAWYCPSLVPGAQEKVFEYTYITSGVRNGYSLYRDFDGSAGLTVSTYAGDNWLDVKSKTGLAPNKWYYLVASYDSATLKIYVNGVLENSMSYSGGIKPTGSNAHIGCQPRMDGSNLYSANGKIDEVKLYNYALTADSIAAHYNALKQPSESVDTPKVVASWSFDSILGNTYYDITNHGYDAVGTGSTLGFSSGLSGRALAFSGDAYKVQIQNSRTNFTQKNFTIEAWINSSVNLIRSSSFDNYTAIFQYEQEASGVAGGYGLTITDKGHPELWMAQTNSSWIQVTDPSTLQPNTWYHVVASYNGSEMRVYLNGVCTNKLAYSGGFVAPQTDALIGCHMSVDGTLRNWFNGKMDEVKLYNYALSPDTILSHYNALKPPQPISIPKTIASWTFDSVAGNTYYDVTGNGYDATGTGLSIVKGVKGNAINCPGSGFNITIANSKDSFALNHFTAEAWYCPGLAPGNQEKVFEYTYITSVVYNGYSLFRYDNGTAALTVSTTAGNDWLTINSKTILNQNQWYHLVASYDSTTLKLYVNGVLENSMAYSGAIRPTGSNAHIGCQPQTNGSIAFPANGKIDEVKFYNYAMAADSILAHYNAFKPPPQPVDTPKTIASWTFDDVAGNTFYDVTGNGYDAVATGDSIRITPDGISGKALETRGNVSLLNMYDISVKNSVPAFNLKKFSIEAWVYSYIDLYNPGSFYNQRNIFEFVTAGMEGSGITGGYALTINDDGTPTFCWSSPTSGSWPQVKGDSALKPNRWYHVAATFDSTAAKLYVNGALIAQALKPSSYYPSTYSARIGCQYQLTTPPSGRTRMFFNGKIDEMKLYNYALDSQTLRKHYEALKPADTKPFKINFGMKTSYCNPGDTVWMPIYLTNFENYAISACQFSLVIDTTKLKLLTISKDSGLVGKSSWVLDWNRNATGSIAVGLMGTRDSIQYGEGEFVRCKFQVQPNIKQGDTCIIGIQNIQIDEKYHLVSASTVPGKIIIKKPAILYGDVTGDGSITIFDARGILGYVVGTVKLPDQNYPNFTPAVADVTGDGTISSYDAALVFQYSLGMLSEFPVAKRGSLSKSLSKSMESVSSQALLWISPASQSSTDGVKFNITGSNLTGFVAGEFSVSYDPTVFDVNKGMVNTSLRGATLYSRIDETSRRIKIALATKDDICSSDPMVLATITIPPNSTSDPSKVFQLATALINEGKIPSNVTAGSIVSVLPDALLKSKTNAREIVFQPTKLIINSDAPFTRVQIFNLAGKMVTKAVITTNGQTVGVVDLKQYRHGTYIYRVSFGTSEVRTGRIVIGR